MLKSLYLLGVWADFGLVVPPGIEPGPTASEAIVLSIGPRDLVSATSEGLPSGEALGKGRILTPPTTQSLDCRIVRW